jgi:hypothetical protein
MGIGKCKNNTTIYNQNHIIYIAHTNKMVREGWWANKEIY